MLFLIENFIKNHRFYFRLTILQSWNCGKLVPLNYIVSSKSKVGGLESDLRAPISIATTLRCRGGRYSIPWIALLYPWSLPYNAGWYQVPFLWIFGMTQPEIEPRSPRPLVNTLLIRPMAQVNIILTKQFELTILYSQLYWFKYSYLILIIFNRSIWPINSTLTCTTTSGQSEPISNGKEGVFHSLQSQSLTIKCNLVESLTSLQEMQSIYSKPQ